MIYTGPGLYELNDGRLVSVIRHPYRDLLVGYIFDNHPTVDYGVRMAVWSNDGVYLKQNTTVEMAIRCRVAMDTLKPIRKKRRKRA